MKSRYVVIGILAVLLTVSGGTCSISTQERFKFISRLNDMDALQGVASDGTYLYNTSSTNAIPGNDMIYKRTKDGTLVVALQNAAQYGTPSTQVNGIFIKDRLLYIGAANGYTGESYIKIYRASDLSYIKEHRVKDYLTEGAAYHDGYWWVIYHHLASISKYDKSWNWIADYPLSYSNTQPNGIVWIGDDIYINNHEDTGSNDSIDVYKWNGSGFNPVARLTRPTPYCTQGLYREPGKDIVWWAERNGGGFGVHNIVKSSIEWQ